MSDTQSMEADGPDGTVDTSEDSETTVTDSTNAAGIYGAGSYAFTSYAQNDATDFSLTQEATDPATGSTSLYESGALDTVAISGTGQTGDETTTTATDLEQELYTSGEELDSSDSGTTTGTLDLDELSLDLPDVNAGGVQTAPAPESPLVLAALANGSFDLGSNTDVSALAPWGQLTLLPIASAAVSAPVAGTMSRVIEDAHTIELGDAATPADAPTPDGATSADASPLGVPATADGAPLDSSALPRRRQALDDFTSQVSGLSALGASVPTESPYWVGDTEPFTAGAEFDAQQPRMQAVAYGGEGAAPEKQPPPVGGAVVGVVAGVAAGQGPQGANAIPKTPGQQQWEAALILAATLDKEAKAILAAQQLFNQIPTIAGFDNDAVNQQVIAQIDKLSNTREAVLENAIRSMSNADLEQIAKNDNDRMQWRAQNEMERRKQAASDQLLEQNKDKNDAIELESARSRYTPSRIGPFKAPQEGSRLSRFAGGVTVALLNTVVGPVNLVVHPDDVAKSLDALISDPKVREAVLEAIKKKLSDPSAQNIGELFVEIPLTVSGGAGTVKVVVKVSNLAKKGTIEILQVGKEAISAKVKPPSPNSGRPITPGTGSEPIIRPGPNSPVPGPPGAKPAPKKGAVSVEQDALDFAAKSKNETMKLNKLKETGNNLADQGYDVRVLGENPAQPGDIAIKGPGLSGEVNAQSKLLGAGTRNAVQSNLAKGSAQAGAGGVTVIDGKAAGLTLEEFEAGYNSFLRTSTGRSGKVIAILGDGSTVTRTFP